MWDCLNNIIMREIRLFLLLLFIAVKCTAQDKPVVDVNILHNWPYILPFEGNIALSRDGRYVAYIISGQPIGQQALVFQDLHAKWKKTILTESAKILFFNSDNRGLCWQQRDTVFLQQMGEDRCQILGKTNVVSYPQNTKGEWLVITGNKPNDIFKLLNLNNRKETTFKSIKNHRWLLGGTKLILNTSADGLEVLNLKSGKADFISGVKDYLMSSDEKSIVLVKKIIETDETCLELVNLEQSKHTTIWIGHNGERPGNFVYDQKGEQIAFTVQSPRGETAIWSYTDGQPTATLKINDKTTRFNNDLPISGITSFSGNGRWLFFNLRKQLPALSHEMVTTPVNIWSYRDGVLNPAQNEKTADFRDYKAVIDLTSGQARLLEHHNDERVDGVSVGDHVILKKGAIDERLPWWPHERPSSNWLVSLVDGKRQELKKQSYRFSPTGRWLYYWDKKLEHYFSLDPKTGKSVNLTENLPTTMINDVEQTAGSEPVGLVGWYVGDSSLLVYDNYDIWKLDPMGNKKPINISGGYGRHNEIKLRLIYGDSHIYKGDEDLLLSGFGVNSQYNGFFRITLDKPGMPELLTMGPYTYFQTTVYKQSFGTGMKPLTGGTGRNKRWIVMRESSTEYPNFYVSNDLKKFTPLTYLQPQKAYNWLNSEAVKWKMYNGQINHGVLYKPENFDPTKRYPILFNYYEKYAQRCYQFPNPGLTTDNINIPWFVSRGYLVFTPDIQYNIASQPGGMTISEAAYNSVASAAEYLSHRIYVNKHKMAIQGHSFGGQETVGIITKTNLFAAAAEMAGTMDNISSYLTLVGDPIESTHKQDSGQSRMSATPWERPDLYQRNSPVHNADKIVTPLFIVHNKKDEAISFRQGIEMYMALRRLGKPCWLLQYDNSGHVLTDKKDAMDYTIRLTQYFDHYLKNKPAPQWMTMNGLGQYKGMNNLYQLDPNGNCGKDCKVCKDWNAKPESQTVALEKNKYE